MRGLNHFVLCGADLDAMRSYYQELGFTVAPVGHHPFGTSNTVIQFPGSYIELLAVTRPADSVEHGPGTFSFAAFNRDYLARHEGFSMVVFDSEDAEDDARAWASAGLAAYAPFRFSRAARLPDGSEVTVGFALAQVTNPRAPWLGHFACQHFLPSYYAQPSYMRHANGVRRVAEVWVSGEGAPDLASHFTSLGGLRAVARSANRVDIQTATGLLVLASPEILAETFGMPPPHPQDGPHLAALVTEYVGDASPTLASLPVRGALRAVPAERAFGVILAFRQGGAD